MVKKITKLAPAERPVGTKIVLSNDDGETFSAANDALSEGQQALGVHEHQAQVIRNQHLSNVDRLVTERNSVMKTLAVKSKINLDSNERWSLDFKTLTWTRTA